MPVLPYDQMKQFYDVLRKHANEDGYCVCSVSYAAKKAGITHATAGLLPGRLEEMGCVKVYRLQLEPSVGRTPLHDVKGGHTHTLIKILEQPFTEDLYMDHFYETTTKVVRKRRQR